MSFTAPEKDGYFRRFHGGDPVDPGEALRRGISRVHVESWAYTARPAPGVAETHFCVDSTGRVCQATRLLERAGPECPPAPRCADLR